MDEKINMQALSGGPGGPPLRCRLSGNFGPTLGRHCGSTRLAALQAAAPSEGHRCRIFRRIAWARIALVLDLARGNIDDQLRELAGIARARFS